MMDETPAHPMTQHHHHQPRTQGRLRCQGRIVRPQMRLLPLSFEGRSSVTCKDIVNTVVVFSEVRKDGLCRCWCLVIIRRMRTCT